MEKVIVKVEDLTIAYHDKPVLRNCDIDIMDGSITAIIGPNGAGKSTLIKGILGLQNKLAGKILIMGEPLKKVQKKIAYIPQSSEVNWDFPTTVMDVVLMGRYVHLGWFRHLRREDREKAGDALKRIGMYDYRDRQISKLSGGQRQRVFIARLIAQEADIYFMDEPLAGIDKLTERVIIDFIKEEQKKGKTAIIVHHDLATIREYFDHVVIINENVVATGRVSEAFTNENLEKAMMKNA